MARVSLELISAIRAAAQKLEDSSLYEWGHMGACNCGFLAQQVTKLTKAEIHRRAMQGYGDWTEQLNDYCPTSGLPMDDLIAELLAFGFDAEELKHLERLSGKNVLQQLPINQRNLKHNIKKDAVMYMRTWANYLEDMLLERIKLPTDEALCVAY
jgi:hypothetical protein